MLFCFQYENSFLYFKNTIYLCYSRFLGIVVPNILTIYILLLFSQEIVLSWSLVLLFTRVGSQRTSLKSPFQNLRKQHIVDIKWWCIYFTAVSGIYKHTIKVSPLPYPVLLHLDDGGIFVKVWCELASPTEELRSRLSTLSAPPAPCNNRCLHHRKWGLLLPY